MPIQIVEIKKHIRNLPAIVVRDRGLMFISDYGDADGYEKTEFEGMTMELRPSTSSTAVGKLVTEGWIFSKGERFRNCLDVVAVSPLIETRTLVIAPELGIAIVGELLDDVLSDLALDAWEC